ncbi:hypothetical protein CLOP_g792 [Closterium sp. NIES-67]|nr:hypothetical protein CLOP_g792 [Closterium sp. NIES-67]
MQHTVTRFKLNNGDEIPAVGLGTWKIAPEDVDAAVSTALEAGYRHFDCSTKYNNEAQVGRALEDGMARMGIERKDLFVTSKLLPSEFSPPDIIPALENTLGDLRLTHLDLFLVSTYPCKWPSLGTPPLREKTGCCRGRWQQLEAAVERGLVRAIGVSKWSVTKLKQLLSWRPVHVPAVNQVEAHPHWRQDAMLASCKGEAYIPLGSRDRLVYDEYLTPPVLLDHPLIKEVAHSLHQSPAHVALCCGIRGGMSVLPKSSYPIQSTPSSSIRYPLPAIRWPGICISPHHKPPCTGASIGDGCVASNLHQSAAQVALRWGILRGMSVLPKSSSPWHIEENIGLFDWSIPPLDFHALCMIEPQVRMLGYYGYWVGEGRPFLEPEELWDDEADTADEEGKAREGCMAAVEERQGG